MADKPALSSPRVTVVMVDGGTWEVQTLNIDMLKWERHALRNKLPVNPGGSPVNWLTYLAWSAGLRENLIPTEVTWPRFSDELCASVNAENVPTGAAVGPTVPEPDTD